MLNTEAVNYVDKEVICVMKYVIDDGLLDLPLKLRAHAHEGGGK